MTSNNIKKRSIAKKADRTAYDVLYRIVAESIQRNRRLITVNILYAVAAYPRWRLCDANFMKASLFAALSYPLSAAN